MDLLFRDLRFAVRTLRASRGFALVALLSLAIGIGSTTTIFSLVNSIYLRRPEFPEPDRLVTVSETSATQLCAGCGVGTSYDGFRDWRETARSLETMAAYAEQPFVVGGGDIPERVTGAVISANLFGLLGVSPAFGRGLVAEEDRAGAPRVALLSDALWRRRFGAARELIGTAIRINGESYTVIGIMPPDFKFPEFAELWIALEAHAVRGSRAERNYGVVARLATGVSVAQADAEMKGIAARLAAEYREQEEWTAEVALLAADQADEVGPYFWVLQGAVLFVLLIVCANLAGLMVARATARQREMAIRVAAGASRSRLLRQMLTESLLLSAAGGALGLVFSFWGVELAARTISEIGVPYYIRFGMDARVLAFGIFLSLLTGLAFGILPALRASTPDVHATLKEGALSTTGSRHRARTRSVLVVMELALALVLLAGAGLMIRTFLRLSQSPSGWADPERVLLSEIVMLDRRFDDTHQVRHTVDALLGRLATMPGTRAAVESARFFAGFGATDRRVTVEGRPNVPDGASPRFYFAVSPGYFDVSGAPLLAGRAFTALDGPGTPGVAIVNDAMATAIWGVDSPIGSRIKLGDPASAAPWLTIIGVARSPEAESESQPRRSYAFVPFAQHPDRQARLIIRTTGDPLALVPRVRAEIAALEADLPLQDIRTMETELSRSYWPVRFYATTLSAMAAFAALLAAIGVWGMVAYAVNLRTREIGIRIALGATAPRVLRTMAAQGITLSAIGLALGLAGSAALTRVIGAMLYGTNPVDPAVFAMVAALFATIALLATLIPARRATRVDPMIALRAE